MRNGGNMDKFEMIDTMIVEADKLIDARGVDKCKGFLNLIQMLSTLRKGLADEDKAHDERVQLLETQLKKLTTPPELKPGETRVGGEVYHIGGDGIVQVDTERRDDA